MRDRSIGIAAAVLSILLLLGAYQLAAALYTPHRPLEVDLAASQADMAVFMVAGRRGDLAMDVARRAVETDPDSAIARHTLAVLFAQQNMLVEAMTQYREAIRCKPDWIDPRINLGILLGQSGRLEEAAEQFRAAGDHPDARYNLEITERALQDQKRRRRP